MRNRTTFSGVTLALITTHSIAALLALAQAPTGSFAVAALKTISPPPAAGNGNDCRLIGRKFAIQFIIARLISFSKAREFLGKKYLIFFCLRVIVEQASRARNGGISVDGKDGVSDSNSQRGRLRINNRNVLFDI